MAFGSKDTHANLIGKNGTTKNKDNFQTKFYLPQMFNKIGIRDMVKVII